jgi:hypothetical protein
MRRITGWSLCALIVFALLVMPGADAGANTGDYAVSPENCVIEPIVFPQPGDVGDLATPSPTPTPVVAEGRTPADDAVVQAVTGRIESAIACQNAGDVLRMLANFTERWVSERFAGYDLVFYSRFRDHAGNPEPLPDEERIELLSIDEVLVRDDGAVLATVNTRAQGEEQTSLVVLVEEAGVWLIDGGAIAPGA